MICLLLALVQNNQSGEMLSLIIFLKFFSSNFSNFSYAKILDIYSSYSDFLANSIIFLAVSVGVRETPNALGEDFS